MKDEQTRFMWAVQALAQPANAQLGLFPPIAEVADELVLEHEETQGDWLDGEPSVSPEQRAAVAALDEHIEAMSEPEDPELWTDDGLRGRSEWNTLRTLARAVLTAMAWSNEAPPVERGAVYVGAPPDDS